MITDPAGYFHIISQDKGFDPLVEHLRNRHLNVRRYDSFATLTFSTPPKATGNQEQLFDKALEHLRKNKTNRPKRKRTLMSNLATIAGRAATEPKVLELIKQLQAKGYIKIGEREELTYLL